MLSMFQVLYFVCVVSVFMDQSSGDSPAATAGPETASAAGPVATTLDPKLKLQRDTIRCVIYNMLSSDGCRAVVGSQTSEDDEIQAGCNKLESFRTLVVQVGCTQNDYNLLHSVTCTWDGTVTCRDYFHQQVDLIDGVESQLKLTCNKSLSPLKNEDPKVYCQAFLNEKDTILSTQSCSPTEVANLEKVICCTGLACFDNTNTSTRHGKVLHTIRTLSPNCAGTMEVAVDEFSKPPTEACVSLDKTKPLLLAGKVCSEDDYARLEAVVCHDENSTCTPGSTAPECTTTAPDPFPNEKQRRDDTQQVILTKLGTTCKNFMLEQVATSVSDPLEKTCKTFLDNYGFIVVGGQCTEEEYKDLRDAMKCGALISTVANLALVLKQCGEQKEHDCHSQLNRLMLSFGVGVFIAAYIVSPEAHKWGLTM